MFDQMTQMAAVPEEYMRRLLKQSLEARWRYSLAQFAQAELVAGFVYGDSDPVRQQSPVAGHEPWSSWYPCLIAPPLHDQLWPVLCLPLLESDLIWFMHIFYFVFRVGCCVFKRRKS